MRLINARAMSDTPPHLGKQRSILGNRDQSIKDGREVAVERLTGGMSIVSVLGDIDSSSYLTLYHSVTSELYQRRCRCMIIDLAQMSFCSACGLSCLIQAHDTACNLGVDLRLAVPPSTALLSIWQLRDLRDTLTIVPTVTDARIRLEADTTTTPPKGRVRHRPPRPSWPAISTTPRRWRANYPGTPKPPWPR
jgi:anti-anti-sigma factor